MKKLNTKGFGAVEALLIVVILAAIGGVGYYVYTSQKKTNTALDNAAKSQSEPQKSEKEEEKSEEGKEEYILPEGYGLYESKESGFKFAYPKEYGQFVEQPSQNQVSINESSTLSPGDYGSGIYGNFKIYSYGSSDAVINSRKYGPEIQLKEGKWIVVQENPSDVIGNKLGEEYRDFSKKTLSNQDNGGLIVYLMGGGDEGSTFNRVVFVTNGRLHEIHLPSFSDGTYANFDNTPPNNPAFYNAMVDNVRNSVRKI